MLEKASRSAADPQQTDDELGAYRNGTEAGHHILETEHTTGNREGTDQPVTHQREPERIDADMASPQETDNDSLPTSTIDRAGRAGAGLVITPDWRERERRTKSSAFRRPLRAAADALRTLEPPTQKLPTLTEIRGMLAQRPSTAEMGALLDRHRLLIGGLAVTLVLSAADTTFGSLVTERPPGPGEHQRVPVAYPLHLASPTPSVRRYLDAVAHGEHLREQAVVTAASRATLDRAKADAAAAVAGESQPWMESMPAPGPLPPGAIPPSVGGYVLPALGAFTSGFGSRWGTFHNGIDIAGPIGSPIYAAADGTVIDAGPASGFGLWVRIRHDDGTISVYGHMYDFVVSRGERVRAGMQIARMGNRGDTTGPHLHFEIIMDGNHIDPQRWLALHGLSYS